MKKLMILMGTLASLFGTSANAAHGESLDHTDESDNNSAKLMKLYAGFEEARSLKSDLGFSEFLKSERHMSNEEIMHLLQDRASIRNLELFASVNGSLPFKY